MKPEKLLRLRKGEILQLPDLSYCEFVEESVCEDGEFYLTSSESGISMSCDKDGVVQSIFLHSGKEEEYSMFDLSSVDLDFGDTKNQVRIRFGTTSRSKGPFFDELMQKNCGGWDAFDFDDYTLHFEYSPDDESIVLITYMITEPVPEQEELVFLFTPSLIATLVNREEKKGASLTEIEVTSVRDSCQVIAVRPEEYESASLSRGYDDIDPENCWNEWIKYKQEITG